MFTLEDMRALLNARPFVPFRLHLSDGGTVDVRSREFVLAGRRYAVIALPDADATDSSFDRYMSVWYLHVTRHEMLSAGLPPFGSPPGPSESPTPSKA
jgi:hypothetical protein